MMSTFITMLVMVLICFLIARRNKDHRTFINLMVVLCVGIFVGAMVKKSEVKAFDKTIVNQNATIDTNSCPTLFNFSPAVVWTDEEKQETMGQEENTKRDSVSIQAERIPAKLEKTEIIDDS